MLQLIPFVLAFTAQRAAAHGGVIGFGNGGTYYPGWRAYNTEVGQVTIARQYATYNPIEDPTSASLSCNIDGTSAPTQLTATVEAGSDFTFYWNQWPHNTGPIITYLAECPGETCDSVDSSTLKWFKIDEAGLVSGTVATGTWAAAAMMANNNSWTSTIPSEVPSGSYLIRHETIALHSLPAQFYPECAQIKIVNGGSRAPTDDELVSFPGAYSSTDAGLSVNLYSSTASSTTTYVVPGPALYGSGTGTSKPVTSSAAAPASSSSVAPAASSSAAPVESSSAAPVESSSAAPVESSSAAPVESTSTAPIESSSAAPIESSSAAPVESSSAAPAVTSSAATPKPTTSSAAAPIVTSSAAAPKPTTTSDAAPVATGSAVAQWGQCGGKNFSGPTTCASSLVCTVMNDFYSQCLTGTLSTSFSSAPAAAQPTTSASATPSASVGSVAHYAQCGGINHKGDTAW
ncbi:glycosyl hydrolase family 61-domain-containing protein [Cyathus striatus]|nr:glycosyl hydrolase family 61-domain-containing protein [Cyathus striatus]